MTIIDAGHRGGCAGLMIYLYIYYWLAVFDNARCEFFQGIGSYINDKRRDGCPRAMEPLFALSGQNDRELVCQEAIATGASGDVYKVSSCSKL